MYHFSLVSDKHRLGSRSTEGNLVRIALHFKKGMHLMRFENFTSVEEPLKI